MDFSVKKIYYINNLLRNSLLGTLKYFHMYNFGVFYPDLVFWSSTRELDENKSDALDFRAVYSVCTNCLGLPFRKFSELIYYIAKVNFSAGRNR